MLQEMLHRSLTPDVVSHSAAISACEKGRHWEEAIRLLREISHSALIADVVSYSAAIEGCGGVGQWVATLQLLQASCHTCLSYSTAVYQHTHLTCASEWAALKLGIATSHVQDLLTIVLTPSLSLKFARSNLTLTSDVVSYSAAISACEKGKHWEGALRLLHEMLEGDLEPDLVSYSVSITAAAIGQW